MYDLEIEFILQFSLQLNCQGMCKIVIWPDDYFPEQQESLQDLEYELMHFEISSKIPATEILY